MYIHYGINVSQQKSTGIKIPLVDQYFNFLIRIFNEKPKQPLGHSIYLFVDEIPFFRLFIIGLRIIEMKKEIEHKFQLFQLGNNPKNVCHVRSS